jgi:TRAP-type mannitol/chloroaromatic compound transport system permease large subunit
MIPGLLLVALYIAYQVTAAWLLPSIAPAIPASERSGDAASGRSLLRALGPPIVLIVAVLGSILGGIATPTEAAAVGAVGATLLAGLRLPGRAWPILLAGVAAIGLVLLASRFDMRIGRREIGSADGAAMIAAGGLTVLLLAGVAVALWRCWRTGVLRGVVESTTTITAMIFATLIGATLFALVFRGLGGDELVKEALADMLGGKYGPIFVVMFLIFLMGFFLDFVEITVIVIPIVGPILLQMDISPIWLGVMIAVNLQTSFLTPPFGFSLFYLRGVAPPTVGTGDIYRGIVPFVILQLIGLALVLAFPSLATWLPSVVF